ncbi:MAG: F0F1 ATP synthase subunit B [Puniceicoccales bacterium]|jgi:F-type H+-transporting ATPase subunit b|nr:F0F1 ATP synthase subunit B [Puniceicoccales bacterium]
MRDYSVLGAGAGEIGELLSRFGVNWASFSAAVVNFALVAAVLYWFAFRPVLKAMDERNAKIAAGLRFADEMKEKLADAEKACAARIEAVGIEAKKIADAALERSREFEERKKQEATQKAEEILRRIRESLEQERNQMLAELRAETARLVVETTGKVIARELTAAERERFNAAAAESLRGV